MGNVPQELGQTRPLLPAAPTVQSTGKGHWLRTYAEEEVDTLEEPKVVNNSKETESSKHSRADVHLSSQRLPEPDGIPTQRGSEHRVLLFVTDTSWERGNQDSPKK